MDNSSKTEEKLKQTFCFKLLKALNKILRHQWPCNKLQLSSSFILNMSGARTSGEWRPSSQSLSRNQLGQL